MLETNRLGHIKTSVIYTQILGFSNNKNMNNKNYKGIINYYEIINFDTVRSNNSALTRYLKYI